MEQRKPNNTARKYEPPQLARYGDIRELTRGSGNSGKKDGGAHSLRTG